MKAFSVTVKMKVADSWIADGFNLNEREEEIKDAFSAMLPYAYGHEVNISVKFGPEPKGMAELQSGEAEAKD